MNSMNAPSPTVQFDAAFGLIGKDLTWLPWVGARFPARQQHQRLLIVGQSHYYKGATPEAREQNRASYADPNSTREVVEEYGYGTKTWCAIPRLLFQTAEIDHARFWEDVAYYNFAQKVMDQNSGQNPDAKDYTDGWLLFPRIMQVLQPSHCLFIGTTAARYFDQTVRAQGLTADPVNWPQKVGRYWAARAKLTTDGHSAELIFVRHLGKFFSHSSWHSYLCSQHQELMTWLRDERYDNPSTSSSQTAPSASGISLPFSNHNSQPSSG